MDIISTPNFSNILLTGFARISRLACVLAVGVWTPGLSQSGYSCGAIKGNTDAVFMALPVRLH